MGCGETERESGDREWLSITVWESEEALEPVRRTQTGSRFCPVRTPRVSRRPIR
jgi:hypothetical protein